MTEQQQARSNNDTALEQQRMCINPKCNSRHDLISASLSVKRYFGVKRSNVGMRDDVCKPCLTEYEKSAENGGAGDAKQTDNLRLEDPVVDISPPVELDNDIFDEEMDFCDDDEDEEKENLDEDDKYISSDDGGVVYDVDVYELREILADKLQKINYNGLIKSSLTNVKGHVDRLAHESMNVSQSFDYLRDQARKRRIEMDESLFGIVREELPPVELEDVILAPLFKFGPNSKKVFSPYSSPGISDPNSPDQQEIIQIGRVAAPGSILPPPGNIRRSELYEHMPVYAMKASYFGIWYKARILEIVQIGNERQFKVRFEPKKGNQAHTRLLSGKHLAYIEPADVILPVGTRIIALYKDEYWNQANSMYAGIIAEPPKAMNGLRYLIFFDDGYAQYINHTQIHLVCEVSKDVWDDIHPDSKEFIRSYLHQYPERPMVKLQKGQVVKTEWNGKWWIARVAQVDASLVKMYFDADKRTEWIYRGSTRLAPLYSELANAEANKAAGKLKRHNLLQPKKKNAPYVEYTRGLDDNQQQQQQRQDEFQSSNDVTENETDSETEMDSGNLEFEIDGYKEKKQVAKKHTASPRHNVAKKSTGQSPKKEFNPSQSYASRVESAGVYEIKYKQNIDSRLLFSDHRCTPACIVNHPTDLAKVKGKNPLLIPMIFGWERLIVKFQAAKKLVLYRTPCGRRLRNMDEIHYYLRCTNSELTVDFFSFDFIVHCFGEFVPSKTFCHIRDISYTKENVPVSCVNSINRQYPEYVEYSTERIPAKGVFLNTDPEFLVGCDCVDDCKDKSKCSCQQLTLSAANGKHYGYNYRRLRGRIETGIYECNPRCKCRKQCLNRVVQNGLQLRLQVFKTEKRGWGLRCLDDVPHGCFICIYAGQLLTEQGANEDGTQFGDEYLAELDYIEVVENKEGYESHVIEPEFDNMALNVERPMEVTSNDGEEVTEQDEGGNETKLSDSGAEKGDRSSDSDYEVNVNERLEPRKKSNRARKSVDQRSDETPKNPETDSEKESTPFLQSPRSLSPGTLQAISETKLIRRPRVRPNQGNENNNNNNNNNNSKEGDREKKLTCKTSRFRALPNPSLHVPPPGAERENKGERRSSVRTYFGEEYCYIMDAKAIGNIGRYLNHSCSPNVFVQNVFVDTHDLRFPWVAFFSTQYIRAGTELTWDYNYEVGSVPGKVLRCYCGAAECRGRLL